MEQLEDRRLLSIGGFGPNDVASDRFDLAAGALASESIDLDEPASWDFGDAPDSAAAPGYPTLQANDGARHLFDSDVYLGSGVDLDPDGQPDPHATGDDNDGTDDEDGVVFTSALLVGQPGTVDVTASVAGLLSVWIDFDGSGNWMEPEDAILVDEPLVAGVNVLTLDVPAAAAPGLTFSRFRFSTIGGLSYEGLADDGEVEDYEIEIEQPGEIRGRKWNDFDGDGVWDAGEPALAGWKIYLDENDNGAWDAAEPLQTTDANGGYAFVGLVPGFHTVAEVFQPNWVQTFPGLGSQIEQLSIAGDGSKGNAASSSPSISADGRYVAFDSVASNLVPGDTNGLWDIFVYGRHAGAIERVSIAHDGQQADGMSGSSSISADGRFVAFYSHAANLVPDDTNGKTDVFVRAVVGAGFPGTHGVYVGPGRTVERVDFGNRPAMDFGDTPDSAAVPGYPTLRANDGARHFFDQDVYLGSGVDLEPDGQPDAYATGDDKDGGDDEDGVVFASAPVVGRPATVEVTASLAGPLNAWIDFNGDGDWSDPGEQVFSDEPLVPGLNSLTVTVPAAAVPGFTFARFRFSTQGGLRFDGPADDGEVEDYEVEIQQPGEIRGRKWNDYDGDGVWDTGEPALAGWKIYLDENDNGVWDAAEPFQTTDAAGNYAFVGLVPGLHTVAEVFQSKWVQTFPDLGSATERVSVASDGSAGKQNSGFPSISADGRYVAFASSASNLVPGDTNSWHDVFVHDRQTGAIQRVSVASDGSQAVGASWNPSISADGRYVAFVSSASTLVPDDNNGSHDVFVYDRQTSAIQRISVAFDGSQAVGDSGSPSISADGRYVAFGSAASKLVPGDTNGNGDVFVYDRHSSAIQRVSVASETALKPLGTVGIPQSAPTATTWPSCRAIPTSCRATTMSARTSSSTTGGPGRSAESAWRPTAPKPLGAVGLRQSAPRAAMWPSRRRLKISCRVIPMAMRTSSSTIDGPAQSSG